MAPKQKKNKLKLNLDASPIKKQRRKKYCNYLDVTDTLVPHIKVVVPTRADIPAGPYLKPIVEAIEDDVELAASLKILQCCHRKGEEKEDGSYDYMPKAPDRRIPWDQFVSYLDSDYTDTKSLGVHVAKNLTEFVKGCSQVRTESEVVVNWKLTSLCCVCMQYDNKIPFELRKVVEKPCHALSHYLFDRDVAAILKRSYSAASKDAIAEDDDVMEAFFGSAESGRAVLDEITEDEWNMI